MNSHFYRALVLISTINYGNSVPPEFCMHPLNKHDCDVPTKPVFSYYHPGSRCEIQFWRGCPTRNMFLDEFTCASVCIYNMYGGGESISRVGDTDKHDVTSNPCIEHYNNDNCGEPKQIKYYFAGDTCVRTEWMGCKSKNLFDNLPACIRACNPILYFEPEVRDIIKELPKEEINDVDELIDHAIHEELKDRELTTVSSELPQNEANDEMNSLNNVTSDNEDNNNSADDVDDNIENDVDDDIENDEHVDEADPSAEHENEADKLAAAGDSEEGSLEEVFTLS